MTVRSYLILIATHPLLLRLAIAALAVIAIAVVHTVAKRLLTPPRTRRTESAAPSVHNEPRRVIATVFF